MSATLEQKKAGREGGVIRVDGLQVPVNRLDKVLYPEAGFTKGQVIDYYIRVAPVLLPHLRDRPLTLKRYPNGVAAPFFYEKHCPAYRPGWVKTIAVPSRVNEEEVNYCVINNAASLIWAANLGDLELHTSLATRRNLERPSMVVFDLDPGPPAGLLECAEVAVRLREELDRMKLKSWVKTSGSKGMQVYMPLNSATDFEETKAFAHRLAELMEEKHPRQIVSNMRKEARRGKVLVDWGQNTRHKTTVCVYSLRAKERPTVSTPVSWREVASALKAEDARRLTFMPEEVLRRVEREGDVFESVIKLRQRLPT